jgi:hypothetical protein
VHPVIMMELLIGLFPVTTMWMWNQFRAPIALAIAGFSLQFAFSRRGRGRLRHALSSNTFPWPPI